MNLRDESPLSILNEFFRDGWARVGAGRVTIQEGEDDWHGTILIDGRPYLNFRRTDHGNYMYELLDKMPHMIRNSLSDHCRMIDQLVHVRLNYPELFMSPDAKDVTHLLKHCTCTNGCKSATCDKL